MDLLLHNIILKVTHLSANGIFFFTPLLMLVRLLFSTYNMESTSSIIESFKGLVSVIFFVFVFKLFFPEFTELSFQQISLSSIEFDGASFWGIITNPIENGFIFLTVVFRTVNYTLVFASLFIVSISFPLSYMVDRLFNYSYFWTLNKLIMTSIFSWLIAMYLCGFSYTGDFTIKVVNGGSLGVEFMRNTAAFGAYVIALLTNLSKSETGNSLDSLGNQMLARHNPEAFNEKVQSGLASGKYRIDDSGIATDRFSLETMNKGSSKDFRDKELAGFIERNSLKSIAEAEQRMKSPESFRAIEQNLSSHKSSISDLIKKNSLTNAGDAELMSSNKEAFDALQSNKNKERTNIDNLMSESITSGKARSISEAKNLLQFEKASQSLAQQSLDSRKKLHSALESEGFESIGDAHLFVEDKTAFDLIANNKNQHSLTSDQTLNKLIEEGSANSIPEAKQALLYPKSYESQNNRHKESKVELDSKLAKVIGSNPVYSIGEARDFVEMPASWSAVKLKSGNQRTRM